MASSNIQGSWALALTFSERVEGLLPERPQRRPSLKARRSFERWRSQKPFGKDEHFEAWLASHQASQDDLYHILAESKSSLKRRRTIPPQWLNGFATAWASGSVPPAAKIFESSTSSAAFLRLLNPIIGHACAQLKSAVDVLSRRSFHAPFQSDRIVELALNSLARRLAVIIGRTMVLELHVARHKDLLTGCTTGDRFAAFLDLLGDKTFVARIFREYPVIIRLASIVSSNWVNAYSEFTSRLVSDWPSICDQFGLDQQNERIKHLDGDMGDCHCEGRTVVIATFGSGIRVVYKPRPASIHRHLSDLFSWLHERGMPALRLPRLLDRGAYGWTEYVTASPCSTREELHDFYRRQGALLAVLHALRAMDFHGENLIAAGEHPVLVDVESLFHIGSELMVTVDGGLDLLAESVMRVGLLPNRQWLKQDGQGTDLSGIGSAPGQPALAEMAVWEDSGTDRMRLARRRLTTPDLPNRPNLRNGEEVNPRFFTEDIVQGFEDTYRVITASRCELLAPEGPLASFSEDEVRRVARPTIVYSMLLSESHHPDLMRNALDRDHFFDRLWVPADTWLKGTADNLLRLIPFEKEDLWTENIPYFLTKVNSRNLWSSRGVSLTDFFQATGLAEVRRRILGFNDGDLSRQTWLIRASMATLANETKQNPPRIVTNRSEAAPLDKSMLIQAAERIGDRIENLAFEDGISVGWIDMTTVNGRFWTLVTDDLNLYSGLPGIALYLAYLGYLTENARYSRLADRALTRIRAVLNQKGGQAETIGAFEGTAGILYLLTHLARLWKRPDLIQEASRLISRISCQAADDNAFDVMTGCAGAIVVLLGFHQTFDSDEAIRAADRLGRRLIQAAQPQSGNSLGWLGTINPELPLTGFSHGVAGIAWALGKLYVATGEESFLRTALGALAFERSLYSEELGGWPDLRGVRGEIRQTGVPHLAAWCHGSVGIGLSRLDLLSCLPSAALEDEIQAAIRLTLRAGFGGSHCLCHGDLGNLELLLQVQQRLPSTELEGKLRFLISSIFADGSRKGWSCDSPGSVERPGLMTGLSGIGYALLRLAKSEVLPSPLLLAPPVDLSV